MRAITRTLRFVSIATSLALFMLSVNLATAEDKPAEKAQDSTVKPLKALLITGGCCHDYAKQKEILKRGIESRAMVQVTLVHSADKGTSARFDIYDNPDWAKGYDVVIHDECSADVKELPYVDNILNAHKN